MEGPLVSDTTELLGGAPSASEDAPAGNPAPAAAGGATSPTSRSRSRGGTGLSSLLLPELQRMAQSMGIQGAGRMRKGQLVEAIQARQGGAGIASQGSDQRVASAGADSTRLRKQDAMEPDTRTQPGIGGGAATGIGASARGQGAGIGADGVEGPGQQQLSFDQAPAGRPQQATAQQAPAQQAPAQQNAAQETSSAPQGTREDTQPGTRDEAAGETQRGDRRRRNGRRDDQPARGRDQSRDQGGRDNSGRDQGGRDNSGRDQGGRDQGGRDGGGQERGSRDREPMAASRGRASGGRSSTPWSGWTRSTASTPSSRGPGPSSPSWCRCTHRTGSAWRPIRPT